MYIIIRNIDRILKNKFLTQLSITYSGINFKTFSMLRFMITSVPIVQSSGFYRSLLRLVPDLVLINHARSEHCIK